MSRAKKKAPPRPKKGPKAKIYVSDPIPLGLEKPGDTFYRIDLEIYGLDHGGASYEGRVFVNNRDANQDTQKSEENGYVGSFYVFAHGGCFGDLGHCDVRMDKRDYDLRPSHPLTQMFTRLIITEPVRRQIEKGAKEFTFSIVPVVKGGDPTMCDFKNVLKFERLALVTFDE
jgi:hypothetical protein